MRRLKKLANEKSPLLSVTSPSRIGKSFIVIVIAALLVTSALCLSTKNVQAQSTQFKISGYVLDSSGRGIAGADVIFNVPSIIQSAITDSSGFYQTSGPAGTYHINVWPPFDSNYINYDQPGFVFSSDVTKNITLSVGCKVYGHITDASGAPVVGATVLLSQTGNNYGSGYFSKSNGYYFVAVPAGTYMVNAYPRTGNYQGPTTSFPQYYEYNFAVTGDTEKNIIVTSAAATSTSTPTSVQNGTRFKVSGYITDSSGKGLANSEVIFNVPSIVPSVYTDANGYYVMSAPAGSYHVNVWPPFDSNYMSFDQSQLAVTSDITKNITLATGYKVYGYITDSSGAPVSKAIVVLNGYLSGWFSKSDGYYFLCVPAGTYNIDCHPGVGANLNALAKFPTYCENNFTVNADVRKDIVVGTKSVSSTTTATPSPTSIDLSTSTPRPIVKPTQSANQAKPATPNTSYNRGQAVTQPNENSADYMVLSFVVTLVAIIVVSGLIGVYKGRATPHTEEQRYL